MANVRPIINYGGRPAEMATGDTLAWPQIDVPADVGYLGNIHLRHGFNAASESTISFNAGTRTYTITPTGASYTAWYAGVKITGVTRSVVLPNVTGLYFISMAADGTLSASTTPWSILTGLPVATVYWYAPGGIFAWNDERHTALRNRSWHLWAHSTIGTRYVSGLGGAFANTTLSIAAGSVADEDIVYEWAGAATSARVWYYSATTAAMLFQSLTTPYIAAAGVLQYDNAGTLTNVSNGQYVINDVYATTDPTSPIWVRIGTAQYSNLGNAQAALSSAAASWQNLTSNELKLLYRVIYRNVGGTATFIQATDYRSASTVTAGTSGTVPLHASTHSETGSDPILSLGSIQFTGDVGFGVAPVVGDGAIQLAHGSTIRYGTNVTLTQSADEDLTFASVAGSARFNVVGDAGTNIFELAVGIGAAWIGSVSAHPVYIESNSTLAIEIGIDQQAWFYKRINAPASVSAFASVNIPAGVAPSAPADGDLWETTAGVFARVNGGSRPVGLAVNTLTDAATIAVNAALGSQHIVTIAASRAMGAPSNPVDGMLCMFKIKQGGAGSYAITWDAAYQFSVAIPAPTLSTAVGSIDYLGFCYEAASGKWHCIGTALGFT